MSLAAWGCRVVVGGAAVAALVWSASSAYAAQYVYVVGNDKDNRGRVSQFAVGPHGVLSRLAVPIAPVGGGSAHAVAVSPDGASAYVATAASALRGEVRQFDVGADGALSPKTPPTVQAGPSPSQVAVSPDGASVYVLNQGVGDGSVSQFNVGPGGALSPKASPVPAGKDVGGTNQYAGAMALSPDGASVYVVGGGENPSTHEHGTVHQFDVGPGGALTPKTPATVPAGEDPRNVAVSPDGTSVYVANTGNVRSTSGDSSVSQFDAGAGGALNPKPSPTVPAGTSGRWFPEGEAVSPDGTSVYVANGYSSVLSQFDVGAGGLLSPKDPPFTPVGYGPVGVAATPDGTSVYVIDNGTYTAQNGRVSQFDVVAGGALSPKNPPALFTASKPSGVAVGPRVSVVATGAGTACWHLPAQAYVNCSFTTKVNATVIAATATLATNGRTAARFRVRPGADHIVRLPITPSRRVRPGMYTVSLTLIDRRHHRSQIRREVRLR